MIYITGDTHRDFDRIYDFCDENCTTIEDVMIILGDACINYYLDEKDDMLKQELSQLPITLFCIHGNHEEYPDEINTYEEMEWHGGIAYAEPEFPNLVFAKDGEFYDFDGKKAIVLGGAYSIDKYYRLRNGLPWFESEQMDDFAIKNAECKLEKVDWQVDYVFSHTVPEFAMPESAFIPGVDQSEIDRTTEKWLQKIYNKLDFERWCAGHFHIEEDSNGIRIMFEDIEELGNL